MRAHLALLAAVLAGCAGAPAPRADADVTAPAGPCAPVPLRTSQKFAAADRATGLPASGQWRDGFALADMNGDGHLDVLHGPARKGQPQPTIFLGDGHGRFAVWQQAHFPPLPYDYGDADAADLNGDGRLDIVLSAHLRGLVTLIDEGGGSYAPWGEGIGLRDPAQSQEPLFSSRDVAVVDWDRDGRPDLLALNEGPSRLGSGRAVPAATALYLNRVGYWEHVQTGGPLQGYGRSLAVGDVDGDGAPDALLGSEVAGARMLLQLGNPRGMRPQELRDLPQGATVTAVALRDVDGDGRAELLVAPRAVDGDRFCTMAWIIDVAVDGAQTTRPLWSDASRDPIVAFAFADLDRDGRGDLLAGRQDGTIMLFAGTRDGYTRDATLVAPPALSGCQLFDLHTADLDEDGYVDVLASYAGESPGTGEPICTTRGGFHAWRLQRR